MEVAEIGQRLLKRAVLMAPGKYNNLCRLVKQHLETGEAPVYPATLEPLRVFSEDELKNWLQDVKERRKESRLDLEIPNDIAEFRTFLAEVKSNTRLRRQFLQHMAWLMEVRQVRPDYVPPPRYGVMANVSREQWEALRDKLATTPVTSEARRDYMREYMRQRRAEIKLGIPNQQSKEETQGGEASQGL